MYTPTANARTRDAIRTAHQERAQAFVRIFRVFR